VSTMPATDRIGVRIPYVVSTMPATDRIGVMNHRLL